MDVAVPQPPPTASKSSGLGMRHKMGSCQLTPKSTTAPRMLATRRNGQSPAPQLHRSDRVEQAGLRSTNHVFWGKTGPHRVWKLGHVPGLPAQTVPVEVVTVCCDTWSSVPACAPFHHPLGGSTYVIAHFGREESQGTCPSLRDGVAKSCLLASKLSRV